MHLGHLLLKLVTTVIGTSQLFSPDLRLVLVRTTTAALASGRIGVVTIVLTGQRV